MKVAALDLGSNTFLCLIAEVTNGQVKKIFDDQVRIVRLGQGVSASKRFHPDALARAKETLTEFKNIISKEKVDRTLAMATAAARDVDNKEDLFKICKDLSIPLEIIPGEKEAEITFSGGISGLPKFSEPILMVDCGGGSTELILGHSEEIFQAISIPIGGVKLTEKFISKYPVLENERKTLQEFIAKNIQEVLPKFSNHQKPNRIVGVAGTPTDLAKSEIGGWYPEKIDGHILNLSQLDRLILQMSQMTPDRIHSELLIEKGRADVILAGAMVIAEVCRAFNLTSLQVSTRGVRFGVALELAKRS